MRNPVKTITLHQVAELVREAWPMAAIPGNIAVGFIFGEDVFLPFSVTYSPVPSYGVPPTTATVDAHPTTGNPTTTKYFHPNTATDDGFISPENIWVTQRSVICV